MRIADDRRVILLTSQSRGYGALDVALDVVVPMNG